MHTSSDKDGKCLCFGCGRRVDGLIKPTGHAFGCPVAQSIRQNPLNEGLSGGRLVDAQLADKAAERMGLDPHP